MTKTVKISISFQVNEDQCRSDEDGFCRFLTFKKFGTTAYCSLFLETLAEDHEHSKILRCDNCLKYFQ